MEADPQNPHKNKVHHVLAQSYSVYFVLFLISIYLDFIFRIGIFDNNTARIAGVIFIIFGTFLVFWAQKSSRVLDKENISKETFRKGPYRHTRYPTHWGMLLLLLGFGIVADALFVVLFTLIAFVISQSVFLKKHDKILTEKYGEHFTEYKKSVKF